MYAALRYVESRGAKTIAAIGRLEVLELYKRAGLCARGLRVKAGAVTYELMAADVRDVRVKLEALEALISRMERVVHWQVKGVPYRCERGCYHGGAFWEGIGDEFETLENRDAIINADVLDAWFDPAPAVIRSLAACLSFALKTSPPTGGEGMRRVIANARRVAEDTVLPGAGSSDLIFAGLRAWVTARSRVLILDPMYAEYAHVLERVIGARVDRLPLARTEGYELDRGVLAKYLSREYDWVVLVNPNSPTGRHIPRCQLEEMLSRGPNNTRFWVDETYVEYAGEDQSLEAYASSSSNVVVCKSMSKVYALSGVRAAYLCGPAQMVGQLRPLCPPWSVSLPSQIAACEALRTLDYYRARWQETHALREALRRGLEQLGWDVVAGCANFLLCHLPVNGPDAATVAARTRRRGLFVRDVGNMGTALGARALRIAVKDGRSNSRILEILRATVAEAT
jgi:histidinol-phosphate/aromatic aminotransferase/cobyric acid decarboxylase-like protein